MLTLESDRKKALICESRVQNSFRFFEDKRKRWSPAQMELDGDSSEGFQEDLCLEQSQLIVRGPEELQ